MLEQQRVLLVTLVYFPYLRMLLRVRPVTPSPTPPLSNAPLLPTKKLQRVTQGITGLLVMHLVNCVVPVPVQILERAQEQQRVLFVLPASILCLRTLLRV